MDFWIIGKRSSRLLSINPALHQSNNSFLPCSARGSRGKADPPDSESGSLGRASRLAPTIFIALKALSVMRSLGRRVNPVQLRVRAPFLAVCPGGHAPASQSSQRSSRFHKPALPRAALGIATIFASMQQPADRFCKAILPEHHRLEDPICWWPCASSSRSPTEETRR